MNILDEALAFACNEEEKNWWHQTTRDCFSTPLSEYTQEKIESHWKFIDFSEQACVNTFLLIATTNQNQNYLLNGIPDTIKDSTWNSVLAISKQRSWYKLHAEVLTQNSLPIVN